MTNGGEFDIVSKLGDSKKRSTFQHTEGVGMPIFFLNKVAREKHRIILDEDRGTIMHLPS